MKVPGSDGRDSIIKSVTEGRVNEQSARKAGAGSAAGGTSSDGVGTPQRVQVDTMKFSSLGAMMRQELNPAVMAEERRAKIEAIKEQIRAGTYAPPSEMIAQALGEEISSEVLFGGGLPPVD